MQLSDQNGDDTEVVAERLRADQETFLRDQRERYYRRAGALLLIVPLVAAIWQIVANNFAQATMNYSIAWTSRRVAEALFTVLGLHVLLWWAWKTHADRVWKPGVVLIALLTLGMMANSAVTRLDDTYFGTWGRLPLGMSMLVLVLYGWTHLSISYFALLAFGAVAPYRLEDRLRPARSQRFTWSIRGLFAGTLIAALLLALLQWLREVYAGVIPDIFYPTSDLAYVLWIGCELIADLFCLYAAVVIRTQKRLLVATLLLVLAVLLTLLGYAAYWFFVPSQSVPFFSLASPIVTGVLMMAILHWVLFGYWQQAGYELTMGDSGKPMPGTDNEQ